MNPGKLHVLLIPELFPDQEGDIRGIFFLDHIKSLAPFVKISVLHLSVNGKAGFSSDSRQGYEYYRYCLPVNRFPGFFKPVLYYLLYRKAKFIVNKINDIDVIHPLTFGAVFGGTVGLKLSRIKNVPLVITENLGPFSSIMKKWYFRKWVRYILKKSDAVNTVSLHQKSEIIECGISHPAFHVVYNPVDTFLFGLKPEPGGNSNRNFLFVGSLDENKGSVRLLRAFQLIAAGNPDWKVTIVGEGIKMDELKKLAGENTELAGRVNLAGKKNKAEIAELMKHADFFVLPGMAESFGIAIAEAMASGLPVIAGKNTAASEFVDAEAGILINSSSIPELSIALEYMINNYQKYNPVLIREKITGLFSFEKYGERICNIYKSLV